MPLKAESEMKSAHLQRGAACWHCRRRKINAKKCDGARPVCGPCQRDNRPEDCEYTHGQRRARAEMLEESIAQIEQRIAELQHPHQYQANQQSRVLLRAPGYGSAAGNAEWTSSAEPPMDLVEKWVDIFLLSSTEFGFFLNPSRFCQSTHLGGSQRPLPALLTVVYLWGIRLSNQPMLLQSHESTFLARALTQTANGLASHHPDRVMHTLQAEILLTYYFFSSGRFLEGKYHAAAAVSLALSTGLNVVRSSNSSCNPSSSAGMGALPTARDAVEEGERVHAWWAVVVLDYTWTVALEDTTHLDLNGVVDTPWPMEVRQYEQGLFDPRKRFNNTVKKFLGGVSTSDTGTSTQAYLAKASILWQRAYTLRRSTQDTVSLDAHLNHFIASLPVPNQFPDLTPAMARTLVVAHSIAHAAAIELHRDNAPTSLSSRRACVASARAIGEIIIAHSSPAGNLAINPIIGTVWRSAARVLMDELADAKYCTYDNNKSAAIENLLRDMVKTMDGFKSTSPLLREHFLPSYAFH
ncbi:Zn(2)-C6 fungal-type domain-containing protein [Mycena kentingensis (nom. inval.)]|nr:Zn(2)-C6 fungal-type domain-containing protein [Mycena kentingensis (nom. inval.)]